MLEIDNDISILQFRLNLAADIKADVDHYCEVTYNDGHRKHLGASLIGDPCSRKLWYIFRWAKAETYTGRQQRLFDRGKREEARFIEWLRGIGAEVHEAASNGKQFRISSCNGHFGGSLDGMVKLPKKYGFSDMLLVEFKTNGTGKGFNELKEKGVAVAKPQHFAQMSIYGAKLDLKYALYMNINKNDDDLYVEVVELDFKLAHTLENKARDIIEAQTAPEKFSFNPATFECSYCHFKGICHGTDKPEVNCRSCVKCAPISNGQWHCDKYNSIIPEEYIKQGCGQWEAIK